MQPRLGLLLFILVVATFANVGCATIRVTDPPRTATEQFLITQAASKAVAQVATAALRDRLVYVDTTNFLPQAGEASFIEGRNDLIILDRQFLVGELRAHLLLNGVRLAARKEEAQIVFEVRSQGIGIDRSDYLLGIPPVLVPAAGVGASDSDSATIVTPEIAFLKNIRQRGFASVAYVAFWRDSGEVVASSGPFVGQTYRVDWWYFGIGPKTTGDVGTTETED